MSSMPMPQATLRDVQHTVVHDLRTLTGRNDGWLAELHIEVPPHLDAHLATLAIRRALADVGIAFVDVRVHPSPGPVRITHARFEERWGG
jgi:hypothetical protein